jgi:hypothetical protein
MGKSQIRRLRPAGAAVVAGELNRCHGRSGFDRTEQLVRDFNELERLARKKGYPSSIDDIYLGRLGERAKELRLHIDKFLSAVELRVLLGMPGKDGWNRHYDFRPETDQQIYHLAGFILDAAFSGQLAKVTECQTCRKWFAAWKQDHQYCSERCRQKYFRSTPEGKAKWAASMRRYRAALKRRDMNRLKAAKRAK